MKDQINKLIRMFSLSIMGGLRLIVPIIIIGTLGTWGVQIMDSSIDFVTQFIEWLTGIHLDRKIMYPLVLTLLLVLSYGVGRIHLGKKLFGFIQRKFLFKIPLYQEVTKITEDLFDIFEKKHGKFEQVVIVKLLDRSMIGFVTATSLSGNTQTVYCPSSPNPMNGFIAIYKAPQIIPLEIEVSKALALILKFGIGSDEVLEIIEKALNVDGEAFPFESRFYYTIISTYTFTTSSRFTHSMLEPLIHAIINTKTDNKNDLMKLKRQFAREMKFDDIPSNIQLIATYNQMIKDSEIEPDEGVAKVLTKSPIRSQSGIVSVQVLTKPFWCPGKCIFCPNDFTMPKSYINTEPGAQRALLNNFDPIKQVYNRLLSLTMTGHKTDKVEMIVLGGTWDVYPEAYKEQFVKALYDACNTFPEFYKNVSLKEGEKKALSYTIDDYDIPYPKTIEESQTINETGPSRIIGLTVETRPEYVTDENCRFWRKLGVTRLEIGIQSSDDAVLKANKRGHDHDCSRQAIHKLRQYGFKMSIHIMPGLYTSSYKKDLKTFHDVYDDPSLKPDEIKFYPTSVIPNTELYDLYKTGEYKPLETEVIKKIIKETFQNIIPPYTRIKRLIRDIPSTEIIAGSSITNLSQLTRQEIRDQIVNSEEAQTLYAKLYQHSKLYATLDEYLTHQSHDLDERYNEIGNLNSGDIITTIIGTQPNMTDYRNFVTLDTRSREIKHRAIRYKGMPEVAEQSKTANLVIRQYTSSVGQEFFVSFEDSLGYIYGFTRLLLPTAEQAIQRESLSATTAVIRELHVYGKLAGLSPLDKSLINGKKIQHTGLGTQLMQTAQLIAAHYNYQKLTVISGIGVRGFYRKIGYELDGTYMSRKLTA